MSFPRVPDCLVFVSHSQPLDYVSSCSETRRIWAGKYSHMWQYVLSLLLRSLPCCFYIPSFPFCSLFLDYVSISRLLLPTYLPSFFPTFSFCALLLPLEVSHYFPKKELLLTATFSKNDAVVWKPHWSGKHMFLCSALVKRKLVKSLIFPMLERQK